MMTTGRCPSASCWRTSSAAGPFGAGEAAEAAEPRATISPEASAAALSHCRRDSSDRSPRTEGSRGLPILRGRDPEESTIAPLARTHGVDGNHVDPLLRELAQELGPGAHAIITADQERALGPADLPFGLLGDLAEGRGLLGNEVHLRAAALREAGKGDQVDAGLVQHIERPRALACPIRHHHLEVLHALHTRHWCLLLETVRSGWPCAARMARRPPRESGAGESWNGRGERI